MNYWYDFIQTEIGDSIIYGLAGNKTDLIFEQYLIYKYSDIATLLITNLTPELLTTKTKFIIDQVHKEFTYCKQITQLLNNPMLMRLNKDFFTKNAPNILKLRERRIKQYKKYLEKVNTNQSIINLSSDIIELYKNTNEKLREYILNNSFAEYKYNTNDSYDEIKGGIKK